MLFASSGSGVALAGSGCSQATNPAQCQYTESVPIIRHHKRPGAGRHHTATNPATTSPGSGKTKSTPTGGTRPRHRATAGRHRHHRLHHHGKSHQTPVQHGSTAGRKGHAIGSDPTHAATGVPTAAATGSGGGMSIWLPVILALVLVGGSAAGILRYRHNR
jgi:hypothetical protein